MARLGKREQARYGLRGDFQKKVISELSLIELMELYHLIKMERLFCEVV